MIHFDINTFDPKEIGVYLYSIRDKLEDPSHFIVKSLKDIKIEDAKYLGDIGLSIALSFLMGFMLFKETTSILQWVGVFIIISLNYYSFNFLKI